jgi:hypothetical protein
VCGVGSVGTVRSSCAGVEVGVCGCGEGDGVPRDSFFRRIYIIDRTAGMAFLYPFFDTSPAGRCVSRRDFGLKPVGREIDIMMTMTMAKTERSVLLLLASL